MSDRAREPTGIAAPNRIRTPIWIVGDHHRALLAKAKSAIMDVQRKQVADDGECSPACQAAMDKLAELTQPAPGHIDLPAMLEAIDAQLQVLERELDDPDRRHSVREARQRVQGVLCEVSGRGE